MVSWNAKTEKTMISLIQCWQHGICINLVLVIKMSSRKLPHNLVLPLATITECMTSTCSCLAGNSSIKVFYAKLIIKIVLGLILHFFINSLFVVLCLA